MLGSEGFLTLTIKMRVRPEPECEEELVDLLKRYRDALKPLSREDSRGEGQADVQGRQVFPHDLQEVGRKAEEGNPQEGQALEQP
jgi:hypothetical protein